MNQKLEVTRYVATQLGLPTDDKSLKIHIRHWWKNIRDKQRGGMQLTEEGFDCLKQAGVKSYKVKYQDLDKSKKTNQMVIHMDNLIDCPWYPKHSFTYVFNERMAVQLMLFSGDVAKYINAKTANR